MKISGADPDFHRRDLFDAIARGDFPEWEFCVQAFDQKTADAFDVRRARRRPSSSPRKIVPLEVDRQDGAQPQPRQLLRRDRAGRLPPRPRGAGHRLHQRPAAAGPAVLLHRHPAHPARRAELPRAPDQPAALPDAQLPARRRQAPERSDRAASPTSRTASIRPGRARAPNAALRPTRSRSRATSSASAPRASPITTARPGSSSAR